MHIEAKLLQMRLELEESGPAAGNYVGAVRVGNVLFVSGHGPRRQGQYITGKVGRDLNVEQPRVINGASDLLVALYGEQGRHARSAVGMQQLPMNIPVEIEMIVEVQE